MTMSWLMINLHKLLTNITILKYVYKKLFKIIVYQLLTYYSKIYGCSEVASRCQRANFVLQNQSVPFRNVHRIIHFAAVLMTSNFAASARASIICNHRCQGIYHTHVTGLVIKSARCLRAFKCKENVMLITLRFQDEIKVRQASV